jgi:hypothetical protein
VFEQGDHPRGVEASMSDEVAFANGKSLCEWHVYLASELPPNAARAEPCDHAKTAASFHKYLIPICHAISKVVDSNNN